MAALIPPATRRAAARVCKALEGMMSLLSQTFVVLRRIKFTYKGMCVCVLLHLCRRHDGACVCRSSV